MAARVVIPLDPKAGYTPAEPPPLSGWPWSEDVDPQTGMPSTPDAAKPPVNAPTPFNPLAGQWGILSDLKLFDSSPMDMTKGVTDAYKKLYDSTFGQVPVVGPLSSGLLDAVTGPGGWQALLWYVVFGVLLLALLFFGVATLLKV